MCPAFSLMNYKVHVSTLTNAVLDLKHDPTTRGQDCHKKYCSNYVQLSRLRSLEGYHLLQSITMEDLKFRTDKRLLIELEMLRGLERETIVSCNKAMIV